MDQNLQVGDIGLVTSFEHGEWPEVYFPKTGSAMKMTMRPVVQRIALGRHGVSVCQLPFLPAFALSANFASHYPLRWGVSIQAGLHLEQHADNFVNGICNKTFR